MINIFYLDKDTSFYHDLQSWLPDFCIIQKLAFELLENMPSFNSNSDILLINPDYTGNNPEFLSLLMKQLPQIPVIFVSETISLPFVVTMVKNGAYSFFHKKKDKSQLIECIMKFLYSSPERDPIDDKNYLTVKEIIGNSQKIHSLKNEIITFGGKGICIHINGETGTGKELAARALHAQNISQKKSMVAVNCGAIPENIIESELFGTERGAFTDAIERIGLFEKADRTTIFLDEIAELSLSAQSKMLRVLEDGIITRIGGSDEIKSDFNLITATNKNLKDEVREGRFREDLYYRITSLIISVPPLRERKEDIYELSEHFLKESGSNKTISQRAVLKLLNHKWPGNIRELKQTIKRAECLSKEERSIEPSHILFY